MCDRRLPGVTYLVVARACCSSTCAFLALRSVGLAGRLGGLGFRSAEFGRFGIGLRLIRGSTGFANTLTIKTIASAVATTESANQIRRTRRQRRPCGSWKTGESEADNVAILVSTLISHPPISKSSHEENLAAKRHKRRKKFDRAGALCAFCGYRKSRPRLGDVDGFGELLGLASDYWTDPNELAGSEVRPQPPHCDKNSYIFRITSFPVLSEW